jgi:hypothetical protein
MDATLNASAHEAYYRSKYSSVGEEQAVIALRAS